MSENLSYICLTKLLLLVLLSNNIVFFNTFQMYFAKTSKTKLRIIRIIINFIWNLNYRDVKFFLFNTPQNMSFSCFELKN